MTRTLTKVLRLCPPALVPALSSGLLPALLLAAACSGNSIHRVDAALPDGGTSDDAAASDDATVSPDDTANEDAANKDVVDLEAGTIIDAGTDDSSCAVVVQEYAAGQGLHADYCSALQFATRPPSSGNHYPTWPAFKIYDKPVPWGYLLHGLEHGVVVISYNCPTGCEDELTAAKTFVASLPKKSGCDTASVILTPDPSLDVRFAASAWNDPKAYTLRASCFDAAVFKRFYTDHVDKNYESSCGGVDWSSNGWCPTGSTSPCGSGCP